MQPGEGRGGQPGLPATADCARGCAESAGPGEAERGSSPRHGAELEERNNMVSAGPPRAFFAAEGQSTGAAKATLVSLCLVQVPALVSVSV